MVGGWGWGGVVGWGGSPRSAPGGTSVSTQGANQPELEEGMPRLMKRCALRASTAGMAARRLKGHAAGTPVSDCGLAPQSAGKAGRHRSGENAWTGEGERRGCHVAPPAASRSACASTRRPARWAAPPAHGLGNVEFRKLKNRAA